MTPRRRTILSLAAGAIAPLAARQAEGVSPIPQDHDLEAFAAAYNHFIASMRAGVIDLKQWARVCRAWRRMTD